MSVLGQSLSLLRSILTILLTCPNSDTLLCCSNNTFLTVYHSKDCLFSADSELRGKQAYWLAALYDVGAIIGTALSVFVLFLVCLFSFLFACFVSCLLVLFLVFLFSFLFACFVSCLLVLFLVCLFLLFVCFSGLPVLFNICSHSSFAFVFRQAATYVERGVATAFFTSKIITHICHGDI